LGVWRDEDQGGLGCATECTPDHCQGATTLEGWLQAVNVVLLLLGSPNTENLQVFSYLKQQFFQPDHLLPVCNLPVEVFLSKFDLFFFLDIVGVGFLNRHTVVESKFMDSFLKGLGGNLS
jgi:hypothetical protein